MAFQLTLWDLVEPIIRPLRRAVQQAAPPSPPAPPVPRRAPKPAPSVSPAPRAKPTAPTAPATSAQDRYDAVVRTMLARHNIRVRKWRKSMSGVAWRLDYADGRSVNLLESPRPKGPMSMAIFLHEVGHHAIGLGIHKPRCLEEFLAWQWSLKTMHAEGLNITDSVHHRMRLSLWYAVSKARRRGLKALPAELLPYVERPRKGRSHADPSAIV